jgi:hypothetical protein
MLMLSSSGVLAYVFDVRVTLIAARLSSARRILSAMIGAKVKLPSEAR